MRVAVDLTPFAGGGISGGLKPFVLHLLQWIARERGGAFTRPPLLDEIEAIRRESDWHVCLGTPGDVQGDQGRKPGLAWAHDAASTWMDLWPADVLYTPWGFSDFFRPAIPSVNLVADTLHRDWPGLLSAEEVMRREQWFQRMLPLAAAVQCNSEFVARQLRTHFCAPDEKLFVIHNAIQDGLLSAVSGSPATLDGKPYFIYPANDWPHKNHERLLKAYADYRRRAGREAWDLVLTGHFARGEAWNLAMAALGIAGSCRVLGHIERPAYANLFRNASALVFPSLYEGFGIPVLEAMSLGVPVACGNLASVPEVAGKAALYFDPRRTSDITAAMDRMGRDAALRARLTAAGLERSKGFSIAREAGLLADKIISVARG
jgi:glycosyltransferase involved in cell wall biosynthesis